MKTALDVLHIPQPCLVNWADMSGDDALRYCHQCDQHVHNLAVLTDAESVALLTQYEGNVCVRVYRRGDGTVVTADHPPRRRWAKFVTAVATLVTALVTGCNRMDGLFCTQGKPASPRPPARTSPTEVLDIPPREVPTLPAPQ